MIYSVGNVSVLEEIGRMGCGFWHYVVLIAYIYIHVGTVHVCMHVDAMTSSVSLQLTFRYVRTLPRPLSSSTKTNNPLRHALNAPPARGHASPSCLPINYHITSQIRSQGFSHSISP